ncbi:hypothetical protein Csp2054_17330 [Curtobacterium sp. 'Ferrero']|nr:hypothetical protein Csp2054_17330 [Curtobacterium sp. 'Ferrero']
MLVEESAPNGDAHFALLCDAGGQHFRGEGSDVDTALRALRSRLEAADLLIQVAGAERDVVVSPMSRQMGQGRQGYRVRLGRSPDGSALVDVLAPADHGVTLAEQADAADRWRRSQSLAGRLAAAFGLQSC